MADEEQKKPEQQPEPPAQSTPPPVDNNSNEIKAGDKKANDTSQKDTSKCNSPQPFIVKVEKSKGWSKQEITSVAAIIISTALFIMTLIAFSKTRESVKISHNALEDARKRDTSATIRIHISDSLDNIQRESNRIKDSISMEFTSQSLQAQINSFNETRKQFELENRPFIQIIDIRVDSVDDKKSPIANYKIVNFGKFPAKLLEIKSMLFIDEPKNENTIMKEKPKPSQFSNSYLSGNTNIQGKTPLNKDMTELGVDAYKSRQIFFYLVVNYSYKSFSPNKTYYAKCVYKIGYNLTNPPAIEALINDEKEYPF